MNVQILLEEPETRRPTIVELINCKKQGYFDVFPGETFSKEDKELVLPDRGILPKMYYFVPGVIDPIRLYKIHNVSISQFAHVSVGCNPLYGGNISTGMAINATKKGIEAAGRGNHATLARAFIFLHANFWTYGHFLLEMLPKLLIYRMLLATDPSMAIFVPKGSPKFVLLWIRFFCPEAVIVFNETDLSLACIEEAYLADMLVTSYIGGAGFGEFLSKISLADAPLPSAKDFERIYISRRSRRAFQPDFRLLENEDEIESVVISEGFKIVQPETLSLCEQVRMFRGAKIVIGELSSALHNAIFSAAGTTVIQFNPFNAVQRLIGLWKQHRVISIAPEDRIIRAWPRDSSVDYRFRISLKELRQALRRAEQAAPM